MSEENEPEEEDTWVCAHCCRTMPESHEAHYGADEAAYCSEECEDQRNYERA